MRHHRFLGLVLVGATPWLVPATAQGTGEPTIPFDDPRLEIEYNATDGDAGFQVFADAEEWKQFEIFRPDGRRILNFRTDGNLNDFGLTELFSESSEPPSRRCRSPSSRGCSLPATTASRAKPSTAGRWPPASGFAHRVLNTPVFIQPEDGGTLPADNAVIRWAPVPGAVDYEVIVTRQDPELVLDVTLSARHRRLTVPAEFLNAGVDYQIEVHASAANGNRIFTQVDFTAT